MRLELKAFGSKVALRVFSSFVVAALIPVIATIILVQTQVRSTLQDQSQARLEESNRALGVAVLDRLILASDALLGAFQAQDFSDSAIFNDVQLIPAESLDISTGAASSLSNFPDRSALGTGPMLTVSDDDGEPGVFSVRRIDDRIAIGRISHDFLWNAAEMLPFGADICVFDNGSGLFLFCSDQVGESTLGTIRQISSNPSSTDSWIEEDSSIMTSYWQLFLPSRFVGTEPWSIFVSQPNSIALAPIAGFNRIFPQVIAICVVLTLLLSAFQIRRIMLPLRQLVAGTKLVADRKFSTRLETKDQNEFSELGNSFNEMTARLGRQFDAMAAFAEIDRLILSSQSIHEVMDKVLARIVALNPEYCVSVLILDPDQSKRGKLYSRVPHEGAATEIARIEMSDESCEWLARINCRSTLLLHRIRVHVDALPVVDNADAAIVVPVFRGDRMRGALFAQTPEREAIPENDYSSLVELTSRLAVAISAADHESELFQRAHFDSLTGLPNRQLCLDRLHQAISQARREEHRLAMLFIDLDDFKNINDGLGHTFGDELLKEVTLRLSAAVRETDTVARLGGDEFVVLLPHVHSILEVEATAEKIAHVVGRPFQIRNQECATSASIGVTVFPDHATDADELLRKADTAMYAAKGNGKSRISFFVDEMDEIVKERIELQQELREALENGDFQLVYQPQLEIETGELIGMEALIRWHHTERGMVPPSTFVPILEDTGLITDVGEWVIEKALSDYSAWNTQGLKLPRIAINVSSRQLISGKFERFIADAIEKSGVQGENIELELTEHSLIESFAIANSVLNNLRRMGVRIAIDDFGTGYSSLGYLQDLHFDVLKIDRAFINGLPGKKSVIIVEAILAVAGALEKEVVAEGIDTEIKRLKLKELGCRIGQGYLFSVPIPADEVIRWSAHLDQTSVIQKLVALDDERIAS